METEPIALTVLPAPAGSTPAPSPVRLWVLDKNVSVGKPFWINLEASGAEIALPATLNIEGIEIDPRNVRTSSSFSFGSGRMKTTEKKGYYATATRDGTITIPPIELRVSGRMVKTEPIDLTVAKGNVVSAPRPQARSQPL